MTQCPPPSDPHAALARAPIAEPDPALPVVLQSHGALLLLRGPELTVVAGSANLEALLGLPLPQLLGRPAAAVLPPLLAERLPPARLALAEESAVTLGELPLGPGGRPLWAQVRSGADTVVLELESAAAILGADRGGPLRWLWHYQQALAGARSVADLGLAASRGLQALTGYERVTLLLADATGELRAIEPTPAGAEPGWWARFTSRWSLVAAERAEVLRQPARVYAVADVDAPAVTLEWAAGAAADGLAGELEPGVLARAPEFLRLGLLGSERAALLITLGDGARPWGCLLCVHPLPRWPSPPLRELCALAGAYLLAELLRRAEPSPSGATRLPPPEPPGPPEAAANLSVVAGGFAHDLNNLLTGVLGSVALVRTAVLTDEMPEPYLEQIETAVLCAGDLCRQLLAHAGHGLFVTEQVHLSRLVAQTLPLLQLALGGRAHLKLDLLDDLPPVVADATQLRQVLLNLVTNGAEAIAAARREGGELTIATRSVYLDADALRDAQAAPDAAPGLHVALQIRDNGVGIEPAVLARVFEPFFTTKPSGSPTGRGLGLTIVLGVVRGHRGVLKVHSAVGEGTDFELLFPGVVEAPAAGAEAPARAAEPATAAAEPRLGDNAPAILMVDDDLKVLEFLARVLRNAGYRVLQAERGEEALRLLQAPGSGVSLVLLDWALVDGDGESMARQIQRLRPGLPLVILSGYAPAEYEKRLQGIAIAGTLQKPFRLDALLSLVQRILNRASGPAK